MSKKELTAYQRLMTDGEKNFAFIPNFPDISGLSCKKCVFYNTLEDECNNDKWYETHCRHEEFVPCELFKAIKECKYRYENCDVNGCSIICHQMPSECGCKFYYECKLDGYRCDEKCEIHNIRHEIKVLKEERGKMYVAKTAVELSLARYLDKITELNEKLNKLENKHED